MRLREYFFGMACVMPILAGCQQKMAYEGRLRPLAPSAEFSDGQSARTPVAGTIARGQLQLDDALFKGKVNGVLLTRNPIPLTPALLTRGRERYNIHCAPCHNETGDGQGMIVQRGFLAPPTYHQDRLRQAPDGHFFEVITNGYGAMYSYADRLEVRDRWAIIAYIRALQRSQHTPAGDLAASERNRFERSGP